MTRIVLALICIAFCVSCKNEAQSTTRNGDFKLEYLFEQDGCKMYRFYDGGRYVYWASCPGKVNADYSTQSGKTRTTHNAETITTGITIADTLRWGTKDAQ